VLSYLCHGRFLLQLNQRSGVYPRLISNWMRDFKRRKLVRNIIYSPLTASVLFVLIFFVGHASVKLFRTYLDTKQDYEVASSAFEELRHREENIEQKIEKLGTERGVEEEIRSKFGFVKEGEEVVIIVEPPISKENSNVQKEDKLLIASIFNAILNIFK